LEGELSRSHPIQYRKALNKDVLRRSRRFARINEDLSRRFLEAFYNTIDAIAIAPNLGSPWQTTRKRLTNLRYRRIIGFEDLMVFYRETTSFIVVMRVLHSHQNISRIFPVNGHN
jgi:plasmid stabilization system protein ParE